jgi:hypothetical protein
MSEHKNKTDSVQEVFADLNVNDGCLHVALALRDKIRPEEKPAIINISSIDEIQDYLDNAPDQVHYLLLVKDDKKRMIKVSYSSKSRKFKFNAQTEGTNVHTEVFGFELFAKLSGKVEPEIWEDFAMEFGNVGAE